MPGVKRLHLESENSGKAPWIFGYYFGVLGMLVANRDTAFCVPVMAELHEGADALRQLQGKDVDKEVSGKITVVSLMANLIKDVAGKLKEPCVAVLDTYFAVGRPCLCIDDHHQPRRRSPLSCNRTGEQQLFVPDRAKAMIPSHAVISKRSEKSHNAKDAFSGRMMAA